MSADEGRDYGSARVSYDSGSLDEDQVAATPLAQFERWYDEAVEAGLAEPSAMAVATVGQDGLPSVRTVLMKGLDRTGFRFFTGLDSRKGRELAAAPGAALLFGWHQMFRQVLVRGDVEPVPRDDVERYFHSRPRDSQLSATVSRQSAEVGGRAEVDRRWTEQAALTEDLAELPVPERWGGFVVRPREIEFWHGRRSRLHDRLVYLPTGDDPHPSLDDVGGWRVRRREP